MCGIAGRWLEQPAAAPMAAVLDVLAHRGPDDRGSWKHPCSGLELGHTRLAIIDLTEAGHQPMSTEDGRVVLVYNGEIYNHAELRSALESRGHRFRGHSDTEVLLALYVEHGLPMLTMLDGMFAFALFDRKSDELILARDTFGIKPLYFTESAAGFAFASELKALPRLIGIAPDIDVAALYRYLSFLWCPGDATPFKAVSRLGPGELLRVRQGRILSRRAWLEPSLRPSHDSRDATVTASDLRSALRTAVKRQLVADVPVGAFLSGGLDSSAIVALAREHAPRIDCFTIVPAGGDDDGDTSDLPYARKVARHLRVPLHEVQIDSARMASDLERMVYILDEPLADPAPLNVLYICQLARSHGMKVLLSGTGGDDLLSGYRRHRALAAERWWSWLPVGARRRLRRVTARLGRRELMEASRLRSGALSAAARRLAKAFAHADAAGDERLVGYFLWSNPSSIHSLFAAEHRASLNEAALTEPIRRFLDALPAGLAPLDRMLAVEQRFFLGDHNLPYADKMSMAASVEVRVPFLDRDLVAFANRLPTSFKQRGRHGKWILKQAMEPLLPRDVIYRPKTGFGAPLRRWLRGELRELIGDVLSPSRLRARGIFDSAAVLDLIERDRKGSIDAAYPILGLLCIELWCRHFLDARAAEAGELSSREVRA